MPYKNSPWKSPEEITQPNVKKCSIIHGRNGVVGMVALWDDNHLSICMGNDSPLNEGAAEGVSCTTEEPCGEEGFVEALNHYRTMGYHFADVDTR